MKLRCLIVDDEPPALDVLRSHIANTPLLEVAGECHNAIGAFDFLQRQRVDLVFLDIQMPKLLGTDLLKALTDPPKVIFTTAHREYAMDGFDLNAVDFLLKPISFDRFLKAVQKAVHTDIRSLRAEDPPLESPRFLYFRADRRMVKVFINEITYIESLKDYVKIYCGQQPLITKHTIMAIEEMLPAEEFLRVHRSFIVAVNKVTSFNQHSVFIGKEEIPVGPLYKSHSFERLRSVK